MNSSGYCYRLLSLKLSSSVLTVLAVKRSDSNEVI